MTIVNVFLWQISPQYTSFTCTLYVHRMNPLFWNIEGIEFSCWSLSDGRLCSSCNIRKCGCVACGSTSKQEWLSVQQSLKLGSLCSVLRSLFPIASVSRTKGKYSITVRSIRRMKYNSKQLGYCSEGRYRRKPGSQLQFCKWGGGRNQKRLGKIIAEWSKQLQVTQCIFSC